MESNNAKNDGNGQKKSSSDLHNDENQVLGGQQQANYYPFATPEHLKLVQDAMMDDLGIGRKDALPLHDRGPHIDSANLTKVEKMTGSALGDRWSSLNLDDASLQDMESDHLFDGELARARERTLRTQAGPRGRGDPLPRGGASFRGWPSSRARGNIPRGPALSSHGVSSTRGSHTPNWTRGVSRPRDRFTQSHRVLDTEHRATRKYPSSTPAQFYGDAPRTSSTNSLTARPAGQSEAAAQHMITARSPAVRPGTPSSTQSTASRQKSAVMKPGRNTGGVFTGKLATEEDFLAQMGFPSSATSSRITGTKKEGMKSNAIVSQAADDSTDPIVPRTTSEPTKGLKGSMWATPAAKSQAAAPNKSSAIYPPAQNVKTGLADSMWNQSDEVDIQKLHVNKKSANSIVQVRDAHSQSKWAKSNAVSSAVTSRSPVSLVDSQVDTPNDVNSEKTVTCCAKISRWDPSFGIFGQFRPGSLELVKEKNLVNVVLRLTVHGQILLSDPIILAGNLTMEEPNKNGSMIFIDSSGSKYRIGVGSHQLASAFYVDYQACLRAAQELDVALTAEYEESSLPVTPSRQATKSISGFMNVEPTLRNAPKALAGVCKSQVQPPTAFPSLISLSDHEEVDHTEVAASMLLHGTQEDLWSLENPKFPLLEVTNKQKLSASAIDLEGAVVFAFPVTSTIRNQSPVAEGPQEASRSDMNLVANKLENHTFSRGSEVKDTPENSKKPKLEDINGLIIGAMSMCNPQRGVRATPSEALESSHSVSHKELVKSSDEAAHPATDSDFSHLVDNLESMKITSPTKSAIVKTKGDTVAPDPVPIKRMTGLASSMWADAPSSSSTTGGLAGPSSGAAPVNKGIGLGTSSLSAAPVNKGNGLATSSSSAAPVNKGNGLATSMWAFGSTTRVTGNFTGLLSNPRFSARSIHESDDDSCSCVDGHKRDQSGLIRSSDGSRVSFSLTRKENIRPKA